MFRIIIKICLLHITQKCMLLSHQQINTRQKQKIVSRLSLCKTTSEQQNSTYQGVQICNSTPGKLKSKSFQRFHFVITKCFCETPHNRVIKSILHH